MASWRPRWDEYPTTLLEFWTERHLCTLTTLRADGRPHVTPVGVALDLEYRCAWVITSRTSLKAKLVGRDPRVAACQVDGRHWSTLEGTASVLDDPESVRRAEDMYAARYRTPRPNPERVAFRIEIDRFLISQSLAADLPSS
ncbi:PPOX class F420-dependent oxidoreductase [Microbacterium paludicola]|uniref:PPOX class F420-dependent oxidoreductase n=1 Tax=Microbacterium paludicola TaxID=300019 RepID=UPI0038796DB8